MVPPLRKLSHATLNRIVCCSLPLPRLPRPSHRADQRRGFDEGGQPSISVEGLSRGAERYHEAEKAGLSSPLLDYNIGLTCYRLGKYDDAVTYLERAYRDEALASLAAYNLGLAERASGNANEAARWFDVAATRASGTPLEKLARQSLAPPQSGMTLAANSPPQHKELEPQRPVGELEHHRAHGLRQRLESESRAVRAVRRPRGARNADGRAGSSVVQLFAAAGDRAVHAARRAAPTPTSCSATTSMPITTRSITRTTRARSACAWARTCCSATPGRGAASSRRNCSPSSTTQRNYDPDNGVDRTLGDEEIWQQYSYTAAGLQADFQHKLGKWGWGFSTLLEHRTYDAVPVIASYDTDLYLFKLRASYAFSVRRRCAPRLHSYRREAAERQSRDIDGTLLSTYPPLDYSYQGVELGVTQRVLRWMSLDFSYMRLDRTDGSRDT